jgi:hypothetical protein
VCARIAGVGALLLPAVEVLRMPPAFADEATRQAFHYQDFPNASLRCELCTFFVPGTKAGVGVCRIIDGEVSAAGWCQAFRPK